MSDIFDRLKKRVEFEDAKHRSAIAGDPSLNKISKRETLAYIQGGEVENARLAPILIALIEDNQRLREALELVRDTPGLGGLDHASNKKWRESSMRIMDKISRETLTASTKALEEVLDGKVK